MKGPLTWFFCVLGAMLVLTALSIVGAMDVQDEAAAHIEYCERIAEGTWPNYKQWSEVKCSKLTLDKMRKIENRR